MTSTVLHSLDDDDIPQDFVDELAEAEWLERKADAAVLLNALLLAGWTPPSRRSKWAGSDLAQRLDFLMSLGMGSTDDMWREVLGEKGTGQ